ncbi:MAG: zinc ribbon domain-containing protein [Thermodesulfobacteriota bacterium]|nr:MAG: zinc ribbon domain-containing protein [Thermodesulfobacteriota bacterium]
MPIYEYECSKCGRIDEVLQKFSDRPLAKCKHCSGKLHKLISHSSFHLKGTGWYITDYANKSQSTAAPSNKGKQETNQSSESPSKKPKKSKKPAD